MTDLFNLPPDAPAFAHEMAAKVKALLDQYLVIQKGDASDPALVEIKKRVEDIVNSTPSWTRPA